MEAEPLRVKRIFVEKKEDFQTEAKSLLKEFKTNLGIPGLRNVRIVNRYDLEGISEEDYYSVRDIVFCDPPVDRLYEEKLPMEADQLIFAMEYLPGQYDQRED